MWESNVQPRYDATSNSAQGEPELTQPEGPGAEILGSLQDALPVSLIQTPLSVLTTCGEDDRIEDVIRDARKAEYDYVPVTGGQGHDEIIGLLHTNPERAGAVRDELAPLSEPLLIGGDASILDFVRQADAQPCRLVLAGLRICGLVTLSDLQKLPARAALFGLMTDLEIVLQDTIREFEPATWRGVLTEGRRAQLDGKLCEARRGKILINDESLYTELCDKLDIVRALTDVKLSLKQKERLVKLRDQLAHANEFAASETGARRTCEAVRDAFGLRELLCTLGRGPASQIRPPSNA